MKKKSYYNVLVVGGGMIGFAIACALGKEGMRVAVFDKLQPVSFKHAQLPDLRVSALSVASAQILRNLGAWPFMERMRMCPYRKMAVWEKLYSPSGKEWNKRFNQIVFDAADIHHDQLGFIVENRVTQLGLLEAMNSMETVDLYTSETIEVINVTTRQPNITLRNGRFFFGDLVIGADGSASKVREQAGIRLATRKYKQQCLTATVEIGITGNQPDITWQAFTETGPEAFLPLPNINGRSYGSIVWYNIPNNIQRLMALSADDFLEELSSTFPLELPPLLKFHNRGYFVLARKHAMSYYKKGVVLIGDSAHTINPLAGQGANLGFQDVAWLAEILIAAFKAGESIGNSYVLERYAKNRRLNNQIMMSMMDVFYDIFSNDIRLLKIFRNIALSIAGQSTLAIKEIMKYAMGISGKQPKLAKPPS